jgi:hypothetical protein
VIWKVPSRTPINPNCVFLNGVVMAPKVQLAADQVSHIYMVCGEYIYGFKNSALVRMTNPVPPWMNLSPSVVPEPSTTDALFHTIG